MFQVCIFYQGPKITYNELPFGKTVLNFLLWHFTLSFFHYKFNQSVEVANVTILLQWPTFVT